ncbi:MAG: sulfotransferase [Thermoanaerobaculia bacterium]|nr:sulfotransferase [Thermoanaerobaculia bacterium]
MPKSIYQLYRRLRHGEPIVVVSGLPRSGTSMAMKMLEAGGLATVVDDLRTADEDNPKGYYEDERVKDLGQMADKSWLEAARGKVIKVISYLLKDLPPTNNYQVIFLRRDLREVLASQTKMLERRGESNETSDERMLELYEDHLWKVNRLLKRSPHLESLDLPYKSVLENPRGAAERLAAFLDRPLDIAKMASMVDESLYRNRS